MKWLRRSEEVTAAWVEERFARHLCALEPFAKAGLPPARVELVSEAAEACARGAPTAPLAAQTVAWAAAVSAAFSALVDRARERDRKGDGWLDLEAVLDAAVRPVLWPERPFATSPTMNDPVRWIHQRGVHAFVKDTEWSFVFDSASPFGPIFELWEAGLWPFATPDGRLVAWAPPDVIGELPMLGFLTPDSVAEIAVRTLRDHALTVGLADAPGTFIYPPVGNPPGPR